MLLGRLARAVLPAGPGGSRAGVVGRLSARWTTTLFVGLDVASALVQSSGSAVASADDWVGPAAQTGINILTAGLALQAATIAVFLLVLVRFHLRARRHARPDAPPTWRKLMVVVYTASVLILVGCPLLRPWCPPPTPNCAFGGCCVRVDG